MSTNKGEKRSRVARSLNRGNGVIITHINSSLYKPIKRCAITRALKSRMIETQTLAVLVVGVQRVVCLRLNPIGMAAGANAEEERERERE